MHQSDDSETKVRLPPACIPNLAEAPGRLPAPIESSSLPPSVDGRSVARDDDAAPAAGLRRADDEEQHDDDGGHQQRHQVELRLVVLMAAAQLPHDR